MEQPDPVKYLSLGASVCLLSWSAEILLNLQALRGLIPKGAGLRFSIRGSGGVRGDGAALGKIRS